MVKTFDYKQAGVDIDKGNEAVRRIKDLVKDTYSPAILSQIGGFAGMVDLKAATKHYQHPVLVQSIDGLGTKPIIAKEIQYYENLGADLLSATANDILVVGAKPVTLLDYIANDQLDPDMIESFIKGLVNACRAHDVALIGGETAEMPDVYLPGEHDFVGVVTGLVDKDKIINGQGIEPGMQVMGFASNGLHTNGYSLARKIFNANQYHYDRYIQECSASLGDVLLRPHLNYTLPVLDILNQEIPIYGMSHITGGGLIENIPRVLPSQCDVQLYQNHWPELPIFKLIQQLGHITDHEMRRTFNLGIGYVMIVSDQDVEKIHTLMETYPDYDLYHIGEVISGHQEVQMTL